MFILRKGGLRYFDHKGSSQYGLILNNSNSWERVSLDIGKHLVSQVRSTRSGYCSVYKATTVMPYIESPMDVLGGKSLSTVRANRRPIQILN